MNSRNMAICSACAPLTRAVSPGVSTKRVRWAEWTRVSAATASGINACAESRPSQTQLAGDRLQRLEHERDVLIEMHSHLGGALHDVYTADIAPEIEHI